MSVITREYQGSQCSTDSIGPVQVALDFLGLGFDTCIFGFILHRTFRHARTAKRLGHLSISQVILRDGECTLMVLSIVLTRSVKALLISCKHLNTQV